MNTMERVSEVFHDIFPKETGPISEETSAKTVKSWDSLRHINFVLAIQTEFGIKFDPRDIARLTNIGDLIAMIDRGTPR